MADEPMAECSFLIPVSRDAELSDGQPHARRLWEWLHIELETRFGGWTLAPGVFTAAYIDPDTKATVRDKSRRYTIAIPENEIEDVRRLLSGVCVLFQQKCIYLSVAGRVEFIEAPKRGKK